MNRSLPLKYVGSLVYALFSRRGKGLHLFGGRTRVFIWWSQQTHRLQTPNVDTGSM